MTRLDRIAFLSAVSVWLLLTIAMLSNNGILGTACVEATLLGCVKEWQSFIGGLGATIAGAGAVWIAWRQAHNRRWERLIEWDRTDNVAQEICDQSLNNINEIRASLNTYIADLNNEKSNEYFIALPRSVIYPVFVPDDVIDRLLGNVSSNIAALFIAMIGDQKIYRELSESAINDIRTDQRVRGHLNFDDVSRSKPIEHVIVRAKFALDAVPILEVMAQRGNSIFRQSQSHKQAILQPGV